MPYNNNIEQTNKTYSSLSVPRRPPSHYYIVCFYAIRIMLLLLLLQLYWIEITMFDHTQLTHTWKHLYFSCNSIAIYLRSCASSCLFPFRCCRCLVKWLFEAEKIDWNRFACRRLCNLYGTNWSSVFLLSRSRRVTSYLLSLVVGIHRIKERQKNGLFIQKVPHWLQQRLLKGKKVRVMQTGMFAQTHTHRVSFTISFLVFTW